ICSASMRTSISTKRKSRPPLPPSILPIVLTPKNTSHRFRLARTLVRANMSSERSMRPAANVAGLRVLGVDPSVAGATGYGIIEFAGSRAELVRFGALKLPTRATFAARLREIHQLIAKLVEEFVPDAVAVESVFAALNMKTALRLAEMRGVVLLAAAQAQIPAHSYSPREIKASVSGFGGASKQQIQQMVKSLLDLPA